MTSPTKETVNNEEEKETLNNSTAETTDGAAVPSCSGMEGEEFGMLLRDSLASIESSTVTKDGRLVTRMFRRISSLRRQFNSKIFLAFVNAVLNPAEHPRAALLTEIFSSVQVPAKSQEDSQSLPPDKEDVEMTCSGSGCGSSTYRGTLQPIRFCEGFEHYRGSVPEIELYLSTIAMMVLLERKRMDDAVKVAQSLVHLLSSFPQPKRHSDLIYSKAVFWVGRVYEINFRLSHLRSFYMGVYRTSVLHHGAASQAVALNMLLRSFLQDELYDQAVQLLEKSPYPESLRSNAQQARYLYYLARINAVRLNYSEAHSKITLALRKAPPEGSRHGRGFRLAVNKLNTIIQLLMGDIPDRRLFNQKDIRQALLPYSKIVQAVRAGDLALFKSVMERHEALFRADRNLILVQRLHYNVIRAGLRRITASYSCISIADVTALLGLDDSDDTYCIIAKAIADGVIAATIDDATQTVQSKNSAEAQAMVEPRKALHSRISFCLQLYNDALKAMQYPEPESESRIEEAEARRKQHQEQLERADQDEFEAGDGADLL